MSHQVKFSLPERELGKADIEFSVKKNGQQLGTLKVSKGSLVWVTKNSQYGHKMRWDDFEEMMMKNGEKEKA
ncbi:hypothetical protein HZA73_08145 [candidate division TA06 bacterium]|nr:hypothetical protein [candidate division TA06 bacterium]